MKLYITGKNSIKGWKPETIHLSRSCTVSGVQHRLKPFRRADAAICVDYHPRFREELNAAQNNGVRTFLVQQEPYVVLPEHRKRNPGKVFDHVLRIGNFRRSYEALR